MFTLSGLRSSLLFKFLENQILRPIRHSFLRIRVIFAAHADAASLTRLCSQRAHIESSSLTLFTWSEILRLRYTSLSVPSLAQPRPYSFQSILIHEWARIAEFDTCTVQLFGLESLLPFSCTCAVVQKIACTWTGARLSASPPDDENYVMRTVHGRGRPKYALAFTPATLCSGFAACTLCMEQSRRFGVVQTRDRPIYRFTDVFPDI